MDEHGFIRYLHSKLDPDVFHWKIHDQFAGGVPDAFYTAKRPLWVEYKYIKTLPKRPSTNLSTCLTVNQQLWLDRLQKANQPCALIIGSGQRAVILVNGQWNTDITRHQFDAQSVTRLEVVAWINKQCL